MKLQEKREEGKYYETRELGGGRSPALSNYDWSFRTGGHQMPSRHRAVRDHPFF